MKAVGPRIFRTGFFAVVIVLALVTPASADSGTVAPDAVGAGELLRCTGDGLVPLPVLNVNVELALTGILLHGTLHEEFANPTDEWIDARYVFPLPEHAAVDSMEMRIGERRISSVIQEKEEARKTFEQARAEGKKASLLSERRPNLFEVSVAGIGPGERVVVEIQYFEEVEYRDGGFRIHFPLTFTPRYSSRAPVEPAAATGASVPTVTLTARIDAGFPIGSIRSSSHALALAREGNVTLVRPRQNPTPADRDFLLEVDPLSGNEPSAALVTEDREDGQYALLMMLPPSPESANPGLATDTLFIVDGSGSMEGPSLAEAKSALQAALGRLRPSDRFNLLEFSDTSELFQPEAQFAEPATVDAAHAWVGSLQATGGTEIVAALVRGMKLMEGDDGNRAKRIILITDGAVDDEDEAFREVSTRLGDVRLHVLGIGGAPNRYLVKKLARFGHGSWEFVAGGDEIDDKVERFLTRIDRPALTNVVLDFEGPPPVDVFPLRLPDLYPGEPLLVSMKLGLAHPGTRAVLRGDGPEGMITSKLEVRESRPVGAGIATRWARAKVESLLDSVHEGAAEEEVRMQVIEIAKQFHLVTKYTSLVAVDDRVTVDGARREGRVSNAMPCEAGSTGELPQGGTNGPLLLRIGIALAAIGAALAFYARKVSA